MLEAQSSGCGTANAREKLRESIQVKQPQLLNWHLSLHDHKEVGPVVGTQCGVFQVDLCETGVLKHVNLGETVVVLDAQCLETVLNLYGLG